MKSKRLSTRKCSALFAASTGIAVCLTGGGAQAAKVTGTIVDTNSAKSVFSGGILYAFGRNAKWLLTSAGGSGRLLFSLYAGAGGTAKENGTANAAHVLFAAHNAGVVVKGTMANGFYDYMRFPSSVASKYVAVQFESGGHACYGWLEVKSTNASGTNIKLGKWGYENTGASIKTLADSVTTQKLSLSNGKVKLHWSNKNEENVARYEVQTKDASGEWKSVDSLVPGEGRYASMVAAGAESRLVVEKVDGGQEVANF